MTECADADSDEHGHVVLLLWTGLPMLAPAAVMPVGGSLPLWKDPCPKEKKPVPDLELLGFTAAKGLGQTPDRRG